MVLTGALWVRQLASTGMQDSNGRYRTIFILGEPGSGKGTQGRLLGDLSGCFYLACGEVFRSLNHRSKLGKTFLDYSGKPVI